jgi:hypothetical protein
MGEGFMKKFDSRGGFRFALLMSLAMVPASQGWADPSPEYARKVREIFAGEEQSVLSAPSSRLGRNPGGKAQIRLLSDLDAWVLDAVAKKGREPDAVQAWLKRRIAAIKSYLEATPAFPLSAAAQALNNADIVTAERFDLLKDKDPKSDKLKAALAPLSELDTTALREAREIQLKILEAVLSKLGTSSSHVGAPDRSDEAADRGNGSFVDAASTDYSDRI